jgi:hypothetical protein
MNRPIFLTLTLTLDSRQDRYDSLLEGNVLESDKFCRNSVTAILEGYRFNDRPYVPDVNHIQLRKIILRAN